MSPSVRPDHRALAAALRLRVLRPAGATPPEERRAVLERAAGGPSTPSPYDDLSRQIGESARLVTDAQVASALVAAGSERAAFEIIMTAAVGAGLLRWQHGIRVLEEAIDASA